MYTRLTKEDYQTSRQAKPTGQPREVGEHRSGVNLERKRTVSSSIGGGRLMYNDEKKKRGGGQNSEELSNPNMRRSGTNSSGSDANAWSLTHRIKGSHGHDEDIYQSPLCRCVGYLIAFLGVSLVLFVFGLIVAQTVKTVFIDAKNKNSTTSD